MLDSDSIALWQDLQQDMACFEWNKKYKHFKLF